MSGFSILAITNGLERIDLLPYGLNGVGWHVKDWTPANTKSKSGGVWQDSPIMDGRVPVFSRDENAVETFDLAVNGNSQDAVIFYMRQLKKLLISARQYWLYPRIKILPVWLEAKAACETETRYALIYDFQIPKDDYPYAPPFYTDGEVTAAMDKITLIIERGDWLDYPPGTGSCLELSGMQTWGYTGWSSNTLQPNNMVQVLFEGATGRLFAGVEAGVAPFLWYTDTGGAVWTAAAVSPSACSSLIEFPGTRLLALSNNGLFSSVDNGANWAARGAGFVPASPVPNGFAMGDDGYLYSIRNNTAVVANDGIMRSSDQGANWTKVWSGAVATDAAWSIYKGSNGYIYAWVRINRVGKLIRSKNGFTSYEIVYAGPTLAPGQFITEIDNYWYASNAGILIGSEDGVNWAILQTVSASILKNMIKCYDGKYRITCIDGNIYVGDAGKFFIAEYAPGGVSPGFSGLANYSVTRRTYAGFFNAANTGEIYVSPEYVTVGKQDDCNDEIVISNKQNIAQLTEIFIYDAAPVTWTDRFPVVPFANFNLFPAVPALADIAYFGASNILANGGPFNNLVFDIIPVNATSITVTWYYWNGGWVALAVQDGTDSFKNSGVNSVHWVPPADWVTTAINGVTAYWVKAEITAIAGAISAPIQQNRDIYTCNWGNIKISSSNIGGDIKPFIRTIFKMRSDKDGVGGSAPDAWTNRYILGTRKLLRGASFSAFLNFAAEQNPTGLTVTDGANTAFAAYIPAPTGWMERYQSPAGSAWNDEVILTFSTSLASEYIGTYHAYLRGMQEAATLVADIRIRLKIITGSGGSPIYTNFVSFAVAGSDWQLLDLGQITLPASQSLDDGEIPDQTQIVVQIWHNAVGTDLNLYDLILIPVDEWSGDYIDLALTTTSVVQNNYVIDIDAITNPRNRLRGIVKLGSGTGLVRAIYQPIVSEPPQLFIEEDQAIWLLTARYASAVWYSEPWIVHSVRAEKAQRYLSMRGNS